MQDEKIILTLSESENALLKDVLKQFDVEILEVNTRSKLLNLAQKEKPLLLIMNISADDGIGGAAVGEAILKVSPHTRIIFVGKDTEKNFVESLSLGDGFLIEPINASIACNVLKSGIVRARLSLTARSKSKDKFDSKTHEKQAVQNFISQLSSARRLGELAEIIDNYLSQMLDYKALLFSTIEPDSNLIRSRIIFKQALSTEALKNVRERLIASINKSEKTAYNFEFISQGVTEDSEEGWLDYYSTSWELKTQRQIGYVHIFNDKLIQLSDPLKNLISTMLIQASTFISWLKELESDRMGFLNTITDIMNEGVLWIDDRRLEVFVNKSARMIFDTCLGTPIKTEMQKDKLFDILRRLNLFETFFGLEAHKQKTISTTLTINDSLIEFNIYRVMQGDRKDFTGTLFVIRNKTQQRDEAQENFEILNMLINEIKEPLKSIDNLSNLLYENLKSQSLSREYFRNIEAIKNSVSKTSEIVNYFVNTNTLRHDTLRKMPVKVEALFDEVVSLFEIIVNERNITIKKEVLPGGTSILADYDKIKLVLKNLVKNSINYTPDGGEITLRSEPSDYTEVSRREKLTRRKRLSDFTKLPRYYVEISCSDTGPGIPEDDHAKVFERFAQAGTPAITGQKGIGLGLTLAQNIIEYHGGIIWIDREYKAGAKVIFSLPVGFQLP